MNFSGNLLLNGLAWFAERLGLALELPEELFTGLFDGGEITKQLSFGRD